MCRREPCIYCELLTTQGQEGSGDSARFLPLGGISRWVGGVPPTSEMESSAWRERGWGAGLCRVRGREDRPLSPLVPQTGEDSASSSLVSFQRDHAGLGIWEPGGPPIPGQESSLVGGWFCKTVSVVTRPETKFHCYLHRESHVTRLL